MADDMTRWLSRDATELAHRLAHDSDEAADCDVLIVGSGYGGAVAAARMAGCSVASSGAEPRRKARVWVVERGLEYLPGRFPRRFSELPGHVRFSHQDERSARGRAEGLMDLRLGDEVNVLLANGLGGGSLINAGVMVQPDPAVFGTGWPTAINAADMQPWYEEALAALRPETSPSYRKTGALGALADRMQVETHPAQVTVAFEPRDGTVAAPPMSACTACGDCMTGCNQGAKRSLDTTYLADAWRRGAEFFCGVTVLRVEPPSCAGAPWQVVWQFTDSALRASAAQCWVLRARHVVLAAGALGSTELLLRSRSDRLPLSARLGARFSTNGDMLAAVYRQQDGLNAVADQETDPGPTGPDRAIGPTITGLVRATQDGQAIVAEEFAVPGALRRVFGEALATFGLANVDVTRPDGFAVTADLLASSGLYGLMGDDGAQGQIELTDADGAPAAGDGRVRIRWQSEEGVARAPVFAAQIAWLQAAVGDPIQVVPNPLWSGLRKAVGVEGPPPRGGIVTVHPLGGCPMADDARAGVVNHLGQVFDAAGAPGALHAGLAVLDGAIVPRALGINPALTITALAEQAVHGLCAAWDLQPAALRRRRLPARVPLPARQVPALLPTRVRLDERLVGPVEIAGLAWWAALQIDGVAINSLADVGAVRREHPAAGASLTLWTRREGEDEFSDWLDEDAAWRCALSATLAILEPTGDDDCSELRYVLQVSQVSAGGAAAAGGAPPLNPGDRLLGMKQLGSRGVTLPPRADGQPGVLEGIWRQLTELELSVVVPPGRQRCGLLRLDFADLARRRSPLLAVQAQSSAPDQLGDLAGLALLALRQSLVLSGVEHFGAPDDYPDAQILRNLASRWPGAVDGQVPQLLRVGRHGARLSHYAPAVPKGDAAPVLLVHGYGASGTTFTHEAIPVPLVAHLLRHGRHAWVLDLRSSIAHEADDPDAPRPGPWPFDEIAVQDIPDAVSLVCEHSGGLQVDVVAHCIGAAMFCVAMLDHGQAHTRVRRAVLSQTGPMMQFSPLNRLRGQVAAHLQQFLGVDELDNRPEFRRRRQADGSVAWQRDEAASERVGNLDALLASYPYPDDDESAVERQTGVRFRRVRRRADAIFGHLMELKNLAPATLGCFDALNGWVKVRSFAQTIHYVNEGLLTDRSGRGRVLTHDRLRERLACPLLILHGRRNRVFDWQGSLRSLRLLQEVRGLATDGPPQPWRDGRAMVWGDDGLKLVRLEDYGHQDCLVGQHAADDVFSHLVAFLDASVAGAAVPPAVVPQPPRPPVEFGVPWLGPVWGDLRRSNAQSRWELRLVAHPAPQRARSMGWLVVPVQAGAAGAWTADWQRARGILPGDDEPWTPNAPGSAQADGFGDAAALMTDATPGITQRALRLALDPDVAHVLVLIVYSDLPLAGLFQEGDGGGSLGGHVLKAKREDIEEALPPDLALVVASPSDWVWPGRLLRPVLTEALDDYVNRLPHAALSGELAQGLVHLPDSVRAAGVTEGAASRQPLCLALTSCQYPPGLLDEDVAQASLARLAQRLEADDPPQLMLAVGDQVYLDATAGVFDAAPQAASAEARVRLAYALNWRMPAFRQVTARLPFYSLMDDHEVRDGWQPLPRQPQTPDEAAALRLHGQLQGSLNPAPWHAETPHFHFRPAGALVVMLDTRRQRAPRRLGSAVAGIDLDHAEIVRPASMKRALELLEAAPPDVAKFFVTPAPLLPLRRPSPGHPAERLRADGWDGYPKSVLEVLDFVQAHAIQRLVFLSGDAHLSALCRVALPSGLVVHGVMSSGLYAPWPFANSDPSDHLLQPGPARVQVGNRTLDLDVQAAQASTHNGFATVAVSGAADDPHAELTVELIPGHGGDVVRYVHPLQAPLPDSVPAAPAVP